MRKLILGTAGHIDHGKTTLVHALTGTDTDRLPEEKRRGITIDIGFASLAIDDRLELGIVDVPGHEAFVRNMLAGATGIDVALLVVAADEGVMPQTREHYAILELLGVTRAVVALTKADLVEDEWLALVREDVRDLIGDGPMADAPILPVSGRTGAGLPELVDAIAGAATGHVERDPDDLFRLPIDRVFSVRGTGTVATGTVWSGHAERDATLRLLPADRPVRLRGLQAHGHDRDRVAAGERAALALAALSREDLSRGDVLVSGEGWKPASMVTVRLRGLSDARPLRTRQRVRFHIGTAEVLGRLVALDGGSIDPGETGWAQLRLETPVVCRAGDRFVVRSYSPVTTIAGGVVVEPQAPKRKRLPPVDAADLVRLSTGDAAVRIAAACRMASWEGLSFDALPVTTGSAPGVVADALRSSRGEAVSVEDRVFDESFIGRARTLLTEAVDAFHRAHPLEQGIDREELRRALPAVAPASLTSAALGDLLADGILRAQGSRVCRADFSPRLTSDQAAALSAVRSVVREAGLAGPTAHDLPPHLAGRPDLPALIRLLEHDGSIVRLTGDLLLDSGVVNTAVATVRQRFAGRTDLAPSDFREMLGLTRKYLIPLLEHMDRSGVTRRHGDAREVGLT